MSKLHLNEAEKKRILNLHRNFVDVPGRRLNEQDTAWLDSITQMDDEERGTIKDVITKFTDIDNPAIKGTVDIWKKIKEGFRKWVTGKMADGTYGDIPPMETGDTFVEWWSRWTPEQQESFMDTTGLDRETIESFDIGMNTAPGSPVPMNEEDWMQKVDKDIEKRGTEGSFHDWCIDHGYKDGCSKECWSAAKKEGGIWSKRAGLARAYCESKH